MPLNARRISIDLNAGTAKFFSDLNAAGAKVREFSGHTVSSMQASSAAIRTLEGNFTNNVRAVERFITSVLPLGPALKAAFPVVGALALGGVVTEVGTKVYEFWKKVRDAGEESAAAFRALNAPIRSANDALEVANARLENEIAKLEGKHQNTLALALEEARAAADRLGESLNKDLASINAMLSKNSVGFTERLMGMGDDRDIKTLFGGESGVGGVGLRVSQIIDQGNAQLDAAIAAAKAKPGGPTKQDVTAVDTMRADIATRANKELANALDEVNKKLRERQVIEKARTVGFYGLTQAERDIYPQNNSTSGSQQGSIEKLQNLAITIPSVQRSIPLNLRNNDLTAQKESLQAARDNRQEDKPFEDRMKQMGAQIDALKAKLEAIGKPEAAQILAKAFGESQKAIEEVNKALERHNTSLTEAQKAQIRSRELTIATTEADAEWRTKLAASSTTIEDRIRSQEMLTAAIGRGYEATKQANVETRLMAELGQHVNDPAWMQSHQADVSQLRSGFAREYDAQHAEQSAQATQKLREEIDLEKALAAAQMQGAEAVREVTIAIKLRQMAVLGATKEQMQAELELANAQHENAIAGDVAKINERIAATERLTAAILGGAEAVRRATLAYKLDAINREGDTPVAGVIGIGARGLATVGEAGADRSKEVAEAAARADRVQAINDEIAKLNEAKATVGDTLAIEIQLRDLENDRLRALAEESLQLRGARDGVRAFFIEMQEDAKSAASIIYDALNSALNESSENLAKMLSGEKKPKGGWGQMWGKEFQGIGEGMVQSSIKSLAQTGLGEIGKKQGVDVGKPDGTSGNPLWVRLAGAGSGLMNAPGSGNTGTGDWGGEVSKGGAFGGSQGGMIFSLFNKLRGGGATPGATGGAGEGDFGGEVTAGAPDWGGFMADGGDVFPGVAYTVGERGQETFVPRTAGSIIPNGGGSPSTHVEYHIDARGAALGVENRIARSIEAAHQSAVATAVRANAEHSKRMPRRSK